MNYRNGFSVLQCTVFFFLTDEVFYFSLYIQYIYICFKSLGHMSVLDIALICSNMIAMQLQWIGMSKLYLFLSKPVSCSDVTSGPQCPLPCLSCDGLQSCCDPALVVGRGTFAYVACTLASCDLYLAWDAIGFTCRKTSLLGANVEYLWNINW